MPELTFQQWLEIGIKQKFCSDLYCENHEGVRYNDMDEYQKYVKKYEGERDFCWSIVHIYEPYGING